jgi:hypothetical protein
VPAAKNAVIRDDRPPLPSALSIRSSQTEPVCVRDRSAEAVRSDWSAYSLPERRMVEADAPLPFGEEVFQPLPPTISLMLGVRRT